MTFKNMEAFFLNDEPVAQTQVELLAEFSE